MAHSGSGLLQSRGISSTTPPHANNPRAGRRAGNRGGNRSGRAARLRPRTEPSADGSVSAPEVNRSRYGLPIRFLRHGIAFRPTQVHDQMKTYRARKKTWKWGKRWLACRDSVHFSRNSSLEYGQRDEHHQIWTVPDFSLVFGASLCRATARHIGRDCCLPCRWRMRC